MRFKEIFEGNNSAYGIMKLTGEVTDKGKAVAKAFIKREKMRLISKFGRSKSRNNRETWPPC